MAAVLSLLETLMPILVCMGLGMLAKKKAILTQEQNDGIAQFVLKFCIPCVLFNSCLQSQLRPESLISMAMLLPILLVSALIGFWIRKKVLHYHNLPMLFAAHETGMIGLPLWIILFGATEAYRMGVLDMTQGLVSIPVMVILTADTGKGLPIGQIVKRVLLSPMLIMSVLGFALGLSGAADWLNTIGIGPILTGTTSFLAQPVSAAILFTIGYNFSLKGEVRGRVLKIAGICLAFSAVACLIMQGILCLVPNVDAATRWVVLLYCALPASFLAPGLAKNKDESAVASGVCSLLTVVTLIVFCLIAVFS